MKTKSIRIGFVAFASSMAFAAPALAAPGRDAGGADVLFREGRKAMHVGNYAVACPKFQESYRLDPAPGTLLNLGDCEEKQGHLVAAWQYFRDAEQGLGRDERSAMAKQRWEALESKLAFVTFKLPAGATSEVRVVRDDVELTAASFGVALPLDPGTHVVHVRAPGTAESNVEITLKGGERREVVLELGASTASKASPIPSATPAVSTTPDPRAASATVLPYVAYGVAAAGLVTLGIGTWQVLDAKSIVDQQCSNGQCDQAGLDAAARGRTFSTVATVGGIVAVAGVAAGTALLVLSPKKNTAVGAGPTIGGFAVSASHQF